VVSKPKFEAHWPLARVHQQKAACAIGVFDFTRVKARLSHQRRLLIARIPVTGTLAITARVDSP